MQTFEEEYFRETVVHLIIIKMLQDVCFKTTEEFAPL